MQGQPMNPPMMQPQLNVPMSGIAATGSMAIPTMLTQLAEEAGRGTDSLMGHLTAGELVVPVEVLDASPMLKKVLADTFADEGLELAQYIVGDELNMRNPTTGQPEFLFKFVKKAFKGLRKVVKKVFDVAKKVAPFVLPFVAPAMLGAIGAGLGGIGGLGAFGTTLGKAATFAARTPWLSAGIGSALGTKIAGGDTRDVLKAFAVGGIGGGITNTLKGGKFFGMQPGSINPFTGSQTPGGEIGAKIPGTSDTQTAVSSAADKGAKVENLGFELDGKQLDVASQGDVKSFSDFNLDNPFEPKSLDITDPNFRGFDFGFDGQGSQNLTTNVASTNYAPTGNIRADRLLSGGAETVTIDRSGNVIGTASQPVKTAAEIAEKGIVERGYEKLGLGALDDVPVLGKAGRFIARNPVISATGLGLATGAFTPEEYEPPSAYELQRQYAMMPNVYDYLAANPAMQIDRAAMFADPIYSDAARLQPDYAAMAAGLRQGMMPRKANQGGFITGPGDERSDDIPAMLSDGEFVMTAKAVRGAGDGDRRKGAQRMYELMDQFQRRAS